MCPFLCRLLPAFLSLPSSPCHYPSLRLLLCVLIFVFVVFFFDLCGAAAKDPFDLRHNLAAKCRGIARRRTCVTLAGQIWAEWTERTPEGWGGVPPHSPDIAAAQEGRVSSTFGLGWGHVFVVWRLLTPTEANNGPIDVDVSLRREEGECHDAGVADSAAATPDCFLRRGAPQDG